MKNKTTRQLDVIRLGVSVTLFLLATLAVLPAPTHFLWMVAIGATELGHVVALASLIACALVWSKRRVGKISALLCALAAILTISPVVRATRAASDLPSQLDAAFGPASPSRPAPFAYSDLINGLDTPEVVGEPMIYSQAGGLDLSLDFYRSQSAEPSPVVVMIHGGYWQSGNNKDFISLNQYLAGRGFAVADILYRLAPEWTFPAPIDDTRAAIAFLRRHASTLNIDPDRVVLLGRSAGGQIALSLAYSATDAGIRGVIAFYAPTDLLWSWEHPENPLVVDTRGVVSRYLGGSPSEAASNYEAASPIRFVSAGLPSTLLIHGGRDELVSVEQSNRLAETLGRARASYFNLSLPWATHGFDYIPNGPGGQISTYAIAHFLDRVTRKAP